MKFLITHWYKRYRLWVWIAAGLVLAYAGAGFWVAPVIIERVLRNRICAQIKRSISVAHIQVNPFLFSVTLKGLAILEKDGAALVSAKRLYANAQLASLFRSVVVFKEVELNGLYLHVVRNQAGHVNFSDILPMSSSPPAPTQAPPKAMGVLLGRLTLNDGQIAFEDRAVEKPFATQWSGIQMQMQALDTRPKAKPVRFQIKAAGQDNETLKITGQATVAPLSVQAQIKMDAVAIAKYAPYYQPYLKGHVTAGTLNLATTAKWAHGSGRIDPLDAQVMDLKISGDQDQPLLTVGRFEVAKADLNIKERTLHLGRIATANGKLWVVRDAQGRINWMDVVPTREPAPQDATPPTDQAAWQVVLDEFALDNYTLAWSDLEPPQPARIDLNQISISAEGLSNRKESPAKVRLAFVWSDQGTVSAQGPLFWAPFGAELKIEAKDLDIRPAQPYISQHLQLIATSGKFNANGTLRIAPTLTQGTDVQFAGQASLNDCQTVDAFKTGDFVKFKSLFLSGLQVSATPLRLTIDEVALTDFFKHLVVYADGSTNLGSIIKRAAAASAPANTSEVKDVKKTASNRQGQGPANPPAAIIRINTITLQGGVVEFNDQLIQPNVRVTLKEVGGRISGLAAIKEHKADILLRGVTAAKIPFEISGQVNPFIERPFVDVKIVFTGIDLSQYAPYSVKYLGYELDKGQISLSLAYHLEDNRLKGQNKVTMNQLTLGQAVESPNATKLPVKMAIALLKDAEGNINLDLPVEGSVDDPQFSLSQIIFTMLGNLVVDIVSSPFKWLGSMFGSGEELQYVDYVAGLPGLPPQSAEKLAVLAKALAQRPGLSLDIQGQIDPEADRNAIRQAEFERQLKSAKLKSSWKAVPLDQVTITSEEKESLIKKAFKEATFPKPRDEKGDLKKLETAEMEKLLITAIEVNDGVLRQLAYDRGGNAKEYLVVQGNVAADRLFVVAPDLSGGKNAETHKIRVQFKVK